MLHFENDYNRGACPEIIERLSVLNDVQFDAYGCDSVCDNARRLIKAHMPNISCDVHFLVGGTQTNLTLISVALRPFECALAADSGHISVHETGAIEATGHKVLTLPGENGKLTAAAVENALTAHDEDVNREHTVKPALVYISDSTEYGTIYTKKELEDLYAVCKKHGVYLYLDGARLGYALAAADSDLTLSDVAENTDAFTIGGTKCGALFGEALVITDTALSRDFRYAMKQKGALLAKGWLLGIQFETLFTDGLYFKLCRRADAIAMKIRIAFEQKGFRLYTETTANQQFIIMPDEIYKKLSEAFVLSYIGRSDADNVIIRFCISWATTDGEAEELIKAIEKL